MCACVCVGVSFSVMVLSISKGGITFSNWLVCRTSLASLSSLSELWSLSWGTIVFFKPAYSFAYSRTSWINSRLLERRAFSGWFLTLINMHWRLHGDFLCVDSSFLFYLWTIPHQEPVPGFITHSPAGGHPCFLSHLAIMNQAAINTWVQQIQNFGYLGKQLEAWSLGSCGKNIIRVFRSCGLFFRTPGPSASFCQQ